METLTRLTQLPAQGLGREDGQVLTGLELARQVWHHGGSKAGPWRVEPENPEP